ncbi:MAG: TatD family deoxyribonuclease [Sphingobacteriales bacterium]|nr:MAG: TatD family deoxyribonuclease [Sphingobacteriales bacterium]
MNFTDTHAHLYDPCFATELDMLLERTTEAGVHKIFLPNCDLETVPAMLQLSARFPNHCFPMIGLHPCYVNENVAAELAGLKAYLATHSFWAIGEIGLDFYWDKTFVAQQEAAFREQIGWAKAAGLPIVIHSREATTACLDIIESEGSGTVPGILHCFSGTVAEAERTVALGLHLGIGGVVTYKKSNLPDVIRAVGIEHLVLETDAPYLAPVPYRGKRNESSYIPYIAQAVADALGLPVAEVARLTTANAERIFASVSGSLLP